MSLIMRLASPSELPTSGTELALDALLDHIACELAIEYVRLMEQAAERQVSASCAFPTDTEDEQ